MVRFKRLNNNKGFTLVELIIVMVLLGVVMTAIFELFNTSSAYVKSVETLNEYQNLTTDVIYKLRAELADCSEVESFDLDSVDDEGAAMYDLTSNYGYIIGNPIVENADGTFSGGGVTINGVDSTGTRLDEENYGTVDATKNYRTLVSFRSEDNGRTTIGVSIVRLDYENPTTGDIEQKVVYTQSTTMMLRSGKGATGQQVVRYRVVS
jgi:prepilin-type N-terminal cleavage/methylation domain-containing protein